MMNNDQFLLFMTALRAHALMLSPHTREAGIKRALDDLNNCVLGAGIMQGMIKEELKFEKIVDSEASNV